jgi:uncharacterized protein (TIGR02598 family)
MKASSGILGFSLVETVVALGLFAFCILGVLALIPIGIGAARSVTEESSATALADAVFGAWAVAPGSAREFSIPYMFTNPAIPVNETTSQTFYFADENEQVESEDLASLQMLYRSSGAIGSGFTVDLVFQWPPGPTSNRTQTRIFQQFVPR